MVGSSTVAWKRNEAGLTPLMVAVEARSARCVRAMLDNMDLSYGAALGFLYGVNPFHVPCWSALAR